ncbi:DNA N-6-adenine-methyltransferase [Mariniphaga sediminis]|jgi:phage N-6-adenine-methyltransferase|uniref:DNA N-6-adenine-methyltransferase n=1 Tax=Mariniphaga sediminis TaxID=1628158 RepID=UPI003566112A
MKENDEWYTPAEIIRSLGDFDLDPATSVEAYRLNQSAKQIYTLEEDGLKQPWNGRVWLNPPYSNPLAKRFLEKMAEHNNGIALVFSKIEAKWFHDVVLGHATAVKFLYERTRFFRPDGTKGMQPRNGSMLVAYGIENAVILMNNTLKGKFVFL